MSDMRKSEKSPNVERARKKKTLRLIGKSTTLKTTAWIGKKRITSETVRQIDTQLKARSLVKVSAHKSAIPSAGIRRLALEIAEATSSELIDIRGHGFTVYREPH